MNNMRMKILLFKYKKTIMQKIHRHTQKKNLRVGGHSSSLNPHLGLPNGAINVFPGHMIGFPGSITNLPLSTK